MKHVVAAFNGGFQAQHGEFGMEANHIPYLGPKPYGATVMELTDGSTAFGTWPPSSRLDGAQIVPQEILSLRQNLTSLVEFDRFNPWQRTWWGGTPPGWGDTIHTARSAICLTKENFVGYFWSAIISADDLAAALLAAGCQYGIHLDMNAGHAGFEFYNVGPTAAWNPLGRPMQTDWEADGKVPQMPDWTFRARRMVRSMGHMLFPRYIQREGRDFFYLTSRTVLPGASILRASAATPLETNEGTWRVKGLPQHGFPYALATTFVRSDPQHPDWNMRVLRVDPRTLVPAGVGGTNIDTPTILTFPGPPPAPDSHAAPGQHRAAHGASSAPAASSGAPRQPHPTATSTDASLWWSSGTFVVAAASPSSEAMALASGQALTKTMTALSPARAAVGINDEDGMLDWVELPPDAPLDAASAATLVALLDKLGCSQKMLVTSGTRALLGGALDLAGEPATGATATLTRLVRGSPPGAHLMFEDTPLVPYTVWQPLQSQHVKVVQPTVSAQR